MVRQCRPPLAPARRRPWLPLLGLALAVAAPLPADAEPATERFPLAVAAGGRHLEDATGRPFLLHGDTAWSLIADLTLDDADLYLRDRAARGFNTILVNLLEHRFTRNAPRNAQGEPPFLAPGDYTAPNERYFAHAERVLRRARDLGLLVLLTPSYIGIGGGDEGWYAAMQRSGPEALHDYGRFLARRFAHLDNIVWVHGGDWNPPNRKLVTAIIDGIREVDPASRHTFHGTPESVMSDFWSGARWPTLDTVYTYGPVYDAMLAQTVRNTGRPYILFESSYEHEGAGTGRPASGRPMRIQAYHALLGGAAGHLFGNNPIWHFDGPGITPVAGTWRDHLDSTGARDMERLAKLFQTLPWWRLRPDLDAALLVDGLDTGKRRAAAALTTDGQVGLVYLPSARRVTLALDRMVGPQVRMQWVDPTGGGRHPAGEPMPPTGRISLTPPGSGTNAAGDDDWLLLLDARRHASAAMQDASAERTVP